MPLWTILIRNLLLHCILSAVNFQLHFQWYAFRYVLLYFNISVVIFCTVQRAYLRAYSSAKKCDMLLLLKGLLYTFSANSTSGFPFLKRIPLYTVEKDLLPTIDLSSWLHCSSLYKKCDVLKKSSLRKLLFQDYGFIDTISVGKYYGLMSIINVNQWNPFRYP